MSHITNTKFYHQAIAKHGYTPQGLRWHSKTSQKVRFHQILSLLPSNTASIVDAGCGFGDLYHYLQQHGRRSIRYSGLDALELMVTEARNRTSQGIYQCDILTDPLLEGEFYVCSGALNILDKKESFRFIERCFHASSRGFIFNFLEGEEYSRIFNYLSVAQIEKLGKKLNARLVFKRHYYERDCTVAFYKKI
ncbi:class I SAM-dependent methyltransferase [Sulfuricurvum sp.]|uniref:class I SAM-dependent methyltransferase n=1 Tax=Sulfuricurvum sp. TaxID=2025608 RepID=UPI00286DC323|nr:class I SAM-dependent methyltransferase [Sulfuricurvum sp.]